MPDSAASEGSPVSLPRGRIPIDHVELAIIGTMIVSPDVVPILVARLRKEHFANGLSGYFFDLVASVHAEYDSVPRTILMRRVHEDAVQTLAEQNLTPGDFVTAAISACATTPKAWILPYAEEMIRDFAAGRMYEIGARTAQQFGYKDESRGAGSIGQSGADPFAVARETITKLDDVLALKRTGARSSAMVGDAARRFVDEVHDRFQRGATRSGISWGFPALDALTDGVSPPQYIIIGARPKMGKSTFATAAALRMAQAGYGVALFSLEMTVTKIVARILADIIASQFQHHFPAGRHLSYRSIEQSRLTPQEMAVVIQAQEHLADLPLALEFERRMTVPVIAAKARKIAGDLAKRGRALHVVWIDYLGLIGYAGKSTGNRAQEIAEINAGLMEVGAELNVPIIALHQLSRDVERRENKRPTPADLRDSGSIEQDADLVMFLYREYAYLQEKARAGDADAQLRLLEFEHELEVIVAMQRGGATGSVRLWCDMASAHIRGRGEDAMAAQEHLDL